MAGFPVAGRGVHRLFFAAAAVQAALSISVWMFARPEQAAGAEWHAHELLFGYVPAVIAGFLLTKSPRPVLMMVLALWVAARLAWFFSSDIPAVAATLGVAATAAITGIAARGFLRGVKRVQNFVFPLLLGLLLGCDILSQLYIFGVGGGMARPAVLLAMYVTVALIVVMGGRIAGAAFSGLVQRAGGARIAPRLGLERIIPLLIGGVAVATAAGEPPVMLATCSWLASAAMLFRMLDWLPGLRLAGPDLLALAGSQLFIAAGLAGIGLQPLGVDWSAASALHLLTVGGIGLATVTMMLKTAAQREGRMPDRGIIAVAALLLVTAAILRAAAEGLGEVAYAGSALAWCSAMLCCFVRMLAR